MKKVRQSDDRWKDMAKAEETVAIAIAMFVVTAIAIAIYACLE